MLTKLEWKRGREKGSNSFFMATDIPMNLSEEIRK